MKINIFLIIGAFLAIVAVSGCTSNNTASTGHFENENISFDYPPTWKVTEKNNTDQITGRFWLITIEDPDSAKKVRIYADFQKPSSIPEYASSPVVISGQNTTYFENGGKTMVKNYRFIKNGTYYQISIEADKNDFNNSKNGFETIMDSVKVY